MQSDKTMAYSPYGFQYGGGHPYYTGPTYHNPYASQPYNHNLTQMNQKQFGQTQQLVNYDEIMGFKHMDPNDRRQLQSLKHDLKMNGVYDPRATPILNKYGYQ